MSRSASASPYSNQDETAASAISSDKFWGIDLESSVYEVPAWQCAVVLTVGVAIPFIVPWYCHGFDFPSSTKHKIVSTLTLMSYLVVLGWVGGVIGIMPESTIVPLLSTIIYTRTSYPYPIVIGHCLSASASYRKNHGGRDNKENSSSYFRSLFGTFFLYGFGGSIVSDLLMGLPVTALSHPRIVPCYLLSWILVWFSPFDIVYRYICRGTLSSNSSDGNKSLFYYMLVATEAIDAVTTPMGRVSRSARELHNRMTAPVMAGLFAGIGGAILRFCASEPGTPTTFQSAIEAGFWKSVCYSILWWGLAVMPCLPESSFQDDSWLAPLYHYTWTSAEVRTVNHCESYNGSDTLRVVIVLCHLAWTLFADVGIVEGHPFVWFSRNVVMRVTTAVCRFQRCGQIQLDSSSNITPDPNIEPRQEDKIESKKDK